MTKRKDYRAQHLANAAEWKRRAQVAAMNLTNSDVGDYATLQAMADYETKRAYAAHP